MVFVEGKAIAMTTNHTLSINQQITDERTKDDPLGPGGEADYAEINVSADSILGTSDKAGANVETYTTLITKQLAGTEVELVMDAVASTAVPGEIPTAGWEAGEDDARWPYLTCDALIDEINISGGSEGNATMSVSFIGVSEITEA